MSFPFLRMSSILSVPSIADVPGAPESFEATKCGQAAPPAALFMYYAIHDRAPDIADVDRRVGTYRRDGVDVTYRRYRLGEHMIVMFRGVPAALRLLANRLC